MDKTAIKAGVPPQPDANGITATPPAPEPKMKPRKSEALRALEFVADLRITVVLFVLAILLVFFGTLAQKEIGTWPAVDRYFRTFFVWIPLEVVTMFVGRANALWDPDAAEALFHIPGSIPFPGGWLIGGLMLVNLLAAHAVRFKMTWRRSGILLIHAGLILMMLGELITGLYAVEGVMPIEVGKSANHVEHHRYAELAFTRVVDATRDEVIAFRPPHLAAGEVIDDERLPFTIKIDEYMPSSDLKNAEKGNGRATAGSGRKFEAVAVEPGRGPDKDQDYPAAYVTLTGRASGKEIGTYLLSAFLEKDWVTAGDQSYQMALRFKRTQRPYTFHLEKFEFKKFVGVDKARDFRSHVHIVDPVRNEERRVEIYMNHPLRYHGETFYQHQAGVRTAQGTSEGTVLQVVRNPAWTLPYLSCAVVSLGMLIHFGLHLARFLERRAA